LAGFDAKDEAFVARSGPEPDPIAGGNGVSRVALKGLEKSAGVALVDDAVVGGNEAVQAMGNNDAAASCAGVVNGQRAILFKLNGPFAREVPFRSDAL
jgi:hypothetical protein